MDARNVHGKETSEALILLFKDNLFSLTYKQQGNYVQIH